MFFDYMSSFITSSSWLRLVLDAVLFALFTVMAKIYKIPLAKGLWYLPLVLAGRDLLSFFVLHPMFFFLSDGALLCIYTWWLHSYNPKLVPARLFNIVTALVVAVATVLSFVLSNFAVSYIVMAIYGLAATLWFTVLISNFSVNNTQGVEFLVEIRLPLVVMFFATRLLLLIEFNIQTPFAQYVLAILAYTPHFFLLFRYIGYFAKKFEEREKYSSTYINSLFDFMRTIGSAMTERIEVKSILNYVINSITKYINADSGVVMLKDGHDGVLRIGAMEGYFPPPFEVPAIVKTKLTGVQKFFENTPIKLGETILGECAASNKAIYIRKTSEDPRMQSNIKDDTLLITSIIAIPLIVNKDVFGVISIMRRSKDSLFTDLEYERSRVFVEYASLTLDSLYNYAQLLEKQEIEREVNIAATIQRKLLPTRTPKAIANMVHAFTRPAKGVSGDYYDIIPLNAMGKFAMVICDVAGKGVPASLIMVMIRTIIHTIGGAKKNAAEVVAWINRGIAGRIDIERFATLSYLTYNPQERLLEYSNAGHHPVLLYRSGTGIVERIDSPGLPIGLERDSEYTLVKVYLETGDTLLSYTDGIIEAMNYRGEQFEEERLVQIFEEHVLKSPKELIDIIRSAVDGFVGQAKQHDDMTMIVLKAD